MTAMSPQRVDLTLIEPLSPVFVVLLHRNAYGSGSGFGLIGAQNRLLHPSHERRRPRPVLQLSTYPYPWHGGQPPLVSHRARRSGCAAERVTTRLRRARLSAAAGRRALAAGRPGRGGVGSDGCCACAAFFGTLWLKESTGVNRKDTTEKDTEKDTEQPQQTN